jgi:hypothetical protein
MDFAYWYEKDRDSIDIDAIWIDIETHSDNLKSET